MKQIIDALFSVPQPSARGFRVRVRPSRSRSRSRSTSYRSSGYGGYGAYGLGSSSSSEDEEEKKRRSNASFVWLIALIVGGALVAFFNRCDDVANSENE